MNKVKITADAVLNIISNVFFDEDVNTVITDPSAPQSWQGKTVMDALNVEYYTFKHRPVSSEEIIAQKMKEGATEVNRLAALNRSFCIVTRGDIERLFSKDTDMSALEPTMEFWIQTSKIKLLEDLIEDCNLATSGLRIPIVFGDETRKAVIVFNGPTVTDIQTGTMCGEMAVCEVTVTLLLYPDVVSYSEYTVEMLFTDQDGQKRCSVPLTSFSCVNTMTQKSVPYIEDVRKVGSINLSRANSFVIVFEGYDNDFINYVTSRTLGGIESATETDNNEGFTMVITRGEQTFTHEVVIKDHQVTVGADTGNETHTLSLTTKGV